ncbi:MAG: alpha/beta hydrolase [Pseudomonadota bacterium]
MRTLIWTATIVFLCWGAAVVALFLFRHSLIYPFRDWPRADQVAGVPGAVAETVAAPDGVPIIAWVVSPRQGRPTILYFGGNAGSLPSVAPRLEEFALHGFGIVAMNYRGSGGAAGKPSQKALISDALAVYDAQFPDMPPVIYGTSLGAALAVQVAAEREAAALVLETPFARLCETAQYHYPIVPVCLLLPDERWESFRAIGAVDAPLLILHGDADRVIPLAHGRKLFDAAPEPKQMIVYPGGDHNDLRLYGAGADTIRFLEGLAKGE